jgi:hypothetical protein
MGRRFESCRAHHDCKAIRRCRQVRLSNSRIVCFRWAGAAVGPLPCWRPLLRGIVSWCRLHPCAGAAGRSVLRYSGTPTRYQALFFLCTACRGCSGHACSDRDSNDPPLRLVTTSFSMCGIYLSSTMFRKLRDEEIPSLARTRPERMSGNSSVSCHLLNAPGGIMQEFGCGIGFNEWFHNLPILPARRPRYGSSAPPRRSSFVFPSYPR